MNNTSIVILALVIVSIMALVLSISNSSSRTSRTGTLSNCEKSDTCPEVTTPPGRYVVLDADGKRLDK